MRRVVVIILFLLTMYHVITHDPKEARRYVKEAEKELASYYEISKQYTFEFIREARELFKRVGSDLGM
ncbi:MAG: hypothetical protein IE916_02785 [Epsilonproteobacteria bacterium]|nr:hypothetical protein [Campylobacterota bacterium]